MSFRIVVLTYPCARTVRLLSALGKSGFAIEAVVIQKNSVLRRAARLARHLGIRSTLLIAIRRLKTEFDSAPSQNPHRLAAYRANARQVVPVRDLNSVEAISALQRLSPDIGVVGCAGILRPEVFHSFRLGVLNIHPGATPGYRGRSPLEWAILEGARPGVTVHFIDDGVDTGPVVQQRELPVRFGDDFDSLYDMAYDVGIQILVSSLKKLQRGDTLPSSLQDCRGSKLRYSMPRRLRNVARRRLRERASSAGD